MSQSWGVKVSKEGKDVLTCGYNDLIFASEFPLLKVHKKGSGTVHIEPAVGTASADISHSTGITPMFLAFTQYADIFGAQWAGDYKQFSFSDIFPDAGGPMGYMNAWAYTDASYLHLSWETDLQDPDDGTDVDYFYYIFEDPIT